METLKKNSLFWDIDQAKLNPVTHGEFLVRRVLEKGDVDDIRWANNFYGKDFVAGVFQKNLEKFDAKSANFWCIYFNLNKSQCIRKQSIQKQSPFWQR